MAAGVAGTDSVDGRPAGAKDALNYHDTNDDGEVSKEEFVTNFMRFSVTERQVQSEPAIDQHLWDAEQEGGGGDGGEGDDEGDEDGEGTEGAGSDDDEEDEEERRDDEEEEEL